MARPENVSSKAGGQRKKVALIEQDPNMYGGTCPNVGCIPSKRLITDAALAPKTDFEAQRAYYRNAVLEKRLLTAALRKGNYDRLIQLGVDVIDGTASFLDRAHVEVKSETDVRVVEGEKFVINTGSRPFIPWIPGLRDNPHVYVSETILDEENLPKRLTMIGGDRTPAQHRFSER